MGAGGSVELSTGTLPRVIVGIDKQSKVVRCKRQHSKACHALSHRWEARDLADTWTVECEYEEPYECKLFEEEIENLIKFLELCSTPVWVDYACINQNDYSDKIAQISIMGYLYYNATTLIVGSKLSHGMPSEDYLCRAWCVQERMFGTVRLPWDMQSCDPARLIEFACLSLEHVPHLRAIRYVNDEKDRHGRMLYLDYVEKQMMKALRSWKYRAARMHIKSIIKLIQSQETSNRRYQVALQALEIRQLISCHSDVDPVQWGMLMFSSQCQVAKDRLYAIWGTPMYQKRQTLPYDDPEKALELVTHSFPAARYAFYNSVSDPCQSLCGYFTFREWDEVALDIILENKTSKSNLPITWSARYTHNTCIVVVVGDRSVGFGFDRDVFRRTPTAEVQIYLVVDIGVLKSQKHKKLFFSAVEQFCERVAIVSSSLTKGLKTTLDILFLALSLVHESQFSPTDVVSKEEHDMLIEESLEHDYVICGGDFDSICALEHEMCVESSPPSNTTLQYSNFLRDVKCAILDILVNGMKILLEQSEIRDVMKHVTCHDAVRIVNSINLVGKISQSEFDALKSLGNDPIILDLWDHRSEFEVPHVLMYYIQRLDRINMPDYVPNLEEIQHCQLSRSYSRVIRKHVNPVNVRFHSYVRIEGYEDFQFVGKLAFIAFAVPLYCYNEKTSSPDDNKVLLALNAFSDLCSYIGGCGSTAYISIVLVLQKNGREFENIVKEHGIRDMFPDHEGNQYDPGSAQDFIVSLFNDIHDSILISRNTKVFVTENVRDIFDSILQDVVLTSSMYDTGLLV